MTARALTTVAGAFAGLALAGLTPACSLIVSFDECEEHADCVSADPEAPPRACGVELTCVEIADYACTAHSECRASFGERFVCGPGGEDRRCFDTRSDQCADIVWPEGDVDKAVILGSVMATSEQFSALVQPLQNAVDLAIRDFNKTTSLPGGRKVAWVACNSDGESSTALTAARHLIEDVGVPAIVGPIFSESVQLVADRVSVDAGVFTISPTATARSITELVDDGLVWRTIASDIYQANALVDWVDAQDGHEAFRVYYLAKEDTYGLGLLDDSADEVLALVSAMIAKPYRNPVGLSEPELKAEYAGVIADAYAFAPDLVIIAGTSEAAQLIGGYVQLHATTPGARELPQFVVTHGAVPSLPPTVEAVGVPALREELMARLQGISPVIIDPENYAVFNNRYRLTFNNEDAITSASLSYDAAMVTILAMATVGEGEAITGAAIRDAMPRLVTGTEVSFGVADLGFISTARDTLAMGGSVDLHGVSGELDFQLDTGEVRTDLVGWTIIPKVEGDTTDVDISPKCFYVLDPEPADSGAWLGCEAMP